MNVLCFGDSNTYGYDPRGYFGGRYDAGSRWVDLLALNDVEADGWLVFWNNVKLFFSRPVVRVISIILLVLVVLLILWKLTLGRRRYRYGRSVSRRRGGGYKGRRR